MLMQRRIMSVTEMFGMCVTAAPGWAAHLAAGAARIHDPGAAADALHIEQAGGASAGASCVQPHAGRAARADGVQGGSGRAAGAGAVGQPRGTAPVVGVCDIAGAIGRDLLPT